MFSKLIFFVLLISGGFCRSITNKMKRNKFSNYIVEPQYFLSPASVELAMASCQKNFKWDRWNCPSAQFLSKINSHQIDREQAFVKALITAAHVYSFTKSCSSGSNSGKCRCNLNEKDNDLNFSWSKCSDNVEIGEQIANEILQISNQSTNDAFSYANWHNSRAGIIIVKNSLQKLCRCHGLSGSCSIKSCWKSLMSFENITNEIRKMYENSVVLRMDNKGILNIKNIKENQLVYIADSPNYCKPNRQCSRPKNGVASIQERRSCKTLCKSCGYRVRKQTKVQYNYCNCKLAPCCNITCDVCSQSVDEYFCDE